MYGEKQILRKLLQKSSLMLLWWFECEKVDLTAEIKISENVLSLFGALYYFRGIIVTHIPITQSSLHVMINQYVVFWPVCVFMDDGVQLGVMCNLLIQWRYSCMYMLHNGLSACQCEVALLQVVGGAYNFQYFWFHCVPIVHCTGWPDSVVYSISGKEGPTLAELI